MEDVISDSQQFLYELPPLEQASEWAQEAVRNKNWPEAAQRWSILRKAYPQQAVTWLQGAKAHVEAEEYEQAEKLLEYGRQNFPQNPNSLIFSAELAMKRKQWDIAKEFLQQSREKFPNFVQTWMKSADYAEHMGNIEQAIAYNEKARLCSPDFIGPYIQYAEIAMRAQQWEEALHRWDILRTHFPNTHIGYHKAAEAARKSGDYKLARQLMLSLEYGDDFFENGSYKNSPLQKTKNKSQIKLFLELIWTKAVFNLRSEVQRNYLSYGWWVLEPLLHMSVYYIVFGLLLQRGGENFPVFLLSGLIPWIWFTKSISGSSGSILAGQNLMLQVGLPSIAFPLIQLLKASLQQLPVFVLLLSFVWIQGFNPNPLWIWLIPIILVQLVITILTACTIAAIIPFVRDLKYLVNTGLMFLMFASGIFYDYRTLPLEWQNLFLLNPVAFLLKCYREILVDGIAPDLLTLAWWGLGGVIACILLFIIYNKLRYIYPRIVLE